MPQNIKEALTYSKRWLELIEKPSVSETEGKQIIEESKKNFADHFNKGWLEYRKSVTEAGDWACVEWTGRKPTSFPRQRPAEFLRQRRRGRKRLPPPAEFAADERGIRRG